MRIALIATYLPPHLGGIERINENLLIGYRAAGHEVRCVTSRIPAHLPLQEGDVVRVPCWNVAEDRLGVPVPVWGAAGWRRLEEAIRWADVVHVVEALYLTSALAVTMARRRGRPVVLSQNVGFIPYRSRVLTGLERIAYATLGRAVLKSASHVVLATPTAEAWIAELLPGGLRSASAFPVGIDTTTFRPATREERAAARRRFGVGEGPVVLFAGRLVEKKGLPVVLEAARGAPDLTFLVAGDGPLRSLLRDAAANVRALGPVPAADMPQLYASADAAVLPSAGEGLPLFVQEAMACGLPTAISDDEVYAVQLVHQGLCFGAPREADPMRAAVRRALAAPEATRARVRAHAVEEWSLARMIARHVALFEALREREIAPA